MKIKILTLIRRSIYAAVRPCALENNAISSANYINREMSRFAEVVVAYCNDSDDIGHHISIHSPDVVVLEAIWAEPAKIEALKQEYPGIRWIVRIHSDTTTLCSEWHTFDYLREYTKIDGVELAAINEKQQRNFSNMGYKSILLPNIYDVETKERPSWLSGWARRKKIQRKGVLNVGCFGSTTLMKNTLNQAIAAVVLADYMGVRLRFHINTKGDLASQEEKSVIESIKRVLCANNAVLHQYCWARKNEFFQKLRQCDVVSQVSMSETFNLITADATVCGVPVIGSKEVYWLPWFLKVRDPNDTSDIARVMYRSLCSWFGVRMSFESLRLEDDLADYSWRVLIRNSSRPTL